MKVHLQKRQDWIRGRREKRKLARLARLRRQLLRYSMLTALVALGAYGFARLPWALSNLNDDIQVHGNKVVSAQQVRAVLRNFIGKPLYRVNPQQLEERVCSLAAVKYAFVRRYIFPHPRLQVEVLEEFPWASFSSTTAGPVEGVIAQTGRIILLSEFPTVLQPPLRLCIPHGWKITPAQIADWDNWTRLIAAQTGQPVTMLDLRNPAAVVADSGKIELRLGAADSTLKHRLSRLASLMLVTEKLQDRLQYVDLSLDSNIPLKVDTTATAAAKEDQLLQEAAQATGQIPADGQSQSQPAPL